MRNKFLRLLTLASVLFVGAPAYGQDVHIMWRCGTTGFAQFCQVEAANPLPVTGTFTPSSSSPNFTPVAPGAATATKGTLLGIQYDSTQKTLTDGQQAAASASARGALFVATGADAFATQSAITAASGAFASGSIASGAMVDLGAIADAAATIGSTGSVSAKLRTLTTSKAPVAPGAATATQADLVGCQATTAAVNPTTGQQGACSSDTNNNILVSAGGAPNLAISQVSVATSDTAVVAARALRRAVTIQQITGTQNVFCNQTTATAANGIVLPAVVGASATFNTTSAIRCIAITGAQTVAVAETF